MFSHFTERERIFVFSAILFIIITSLFLIIKKVSGLRQELTESVNESATHAAQMDRLINDFNYYRALKTGGRDEDVSEIYAKLDQILIRYGLKEKVSTMKDTSVETKNKYTETSIDVSFVSVNLNDIIKLIYDIEKNKQINGKVTVFQSKKSFKDANKELYDITLQISSYKKSIPAPGGKR